MYLLLFVPFSPHLSLVHTPVQVDLPTANKPYRIRRRWSDSDGVVKLFEASVK